MKSWKNYSRRSLWQHPFWSDFQQKIGRKTWHLEVDGAQALVIKQAMPFGLNWLEVPRGPLFENEESLSKILDKIGEIAQKEQSVFVRLSSYEQLGREGLRVTNYDRHPQTSLVLDLSLSEEKLLAQMKPKGRYNIKVAVKHHVEVAVSDDVEAFYNILKHTAHRDGFHLHDLSYYEHFLKSMTGSAQLLLATYQDRVIAGGLFVYLDEWGVYYYGASDHHYRKVMAPYLIQWEAIKEAKKRGCEFYDFLGISPEKSKNHTWAGVTQFKKKFGGQVICYPKAQEWVLRRGVYWLYQLYKRLR